MLFVKTLPNQPKIERIAYTPTVSTVCPVEDVPFEARIEITFNPGEHLLEFVSFDDWLKERVKYKKHTIEDLTRLVFDKVTEVLGDIPLSVTVTGTTTVHAPARATIKRGEP